MDPSSLFKRVMDVLASFVLMATFSPLYLVIALAILFIDGLPILFKQNRVGQFGSPFTIYKFRTMRPAGELKGPDVTAASNARITPLGRFLRNSKLDEIPQLYNVLVGDMSLVGPRPEVATYVNSSEEDWKGVLALMPGVTDSASLFFRSEEQLLARAANPESMYISVVLPEKLRINLEYAQQATIFSDMLILIRTVVISLFPNAAPSLSPTFRAKIDAYLKAEGEIRRTV